MNHDLPAYGLWSLVLINSAVFILFAFSFFKPKTRRDWRSFGGFSAFIVALFVEMYGFPLTIYLISGWLARRIPGVDPLGHDVGHLWYTLLGFKGNPHLNPIHIASNLIIVGGFFLLSGAWRVLYQAQREGALAAEGPYRYLRHPQYAGFILIMSGFLLQWPTFITLLMFPILVAGYVRLAHREEQEVADEFGDAWTRYAAVTPRWLPRLGRIARPPPPQGDRETEVHPATQPRVALQGQPPRRGGNQ
jgi:methanethiol S-methyltransferase